METNLPETIASRHTVMKKKKNLFLLDLISDPPTPAAKVPQYIELVPYLYRYGSMATR